MSVLILPRPYLEEKLQALIAPNTMRASMGVGSRRDAGRVAWLARSGQPGPAERSFQISTGEPPVDLATAIPVDAAGMLWLGR
ncbi:MAG: hypothetical protein ABSE84_24295 [Isosphaeraceae bacterium]